MTDFKNERYFKYVNYKNEKRPYKNTKINYILNSFDGWYHKNFPLKGKRILDFGCSIKSYLYDRYVKENDSDAGYFGYDVEEAVIKWLRDSKKYFDPFASGNINEDSKFDYIFLIDVYEHLEPSERVDMIIAAHSLLKEKGKLFIAYPYMKNLNFFVNGISDPTHKLTDFEGEVANFIEHGNFASDKVNLYLGGWSTPALSFYKNLLALLRNLICLFPPFHVAVIVAEK
jgi:hypothetical protein